MFHVKQNLSVGDVGPAIGDLVVPGPSIGIAPRRGLSIRSSPVSHGTLPRPRTTAFPLAVHSILTPGTSKVAPRLWACRHCRKGGGPSSIPRCEAMQRTISGLSRWPCFRFTVTCPSRIFRLPQVPRSFIAGRKRTSPEPRIMSRVIAIANQKGGVGKTTTAINLGAALAVAEHPTLIVDTDPQGNATSGMGIEGRDALPTIYDVLVEQRPIEEAILEEVHFPYLDMIPSTRDLVGAEIELVGAGSRETILKKALEPVRSKYEFILVDCPPSLGLLTLNTLAAADSVLIPIQCEFYALEGLSQLLNTIRLVQRNLNPQLEIEGVLLTMFDRRLNLSNQVAEEAREYFGDKVYETVIPRNVRLAEAPSFGQPILQYDILSTGAQSYLRLANEIDDRRARDSGGEVPELPEPQPTEAERS